MATSLVLFILDETHTDTYSIAMTSSPKSFSNISNFHQDAVRKKKTIMITSNPKKTTIKVIAKSSSKSIRESQSSGDFKTLTCSGGLLGSLISSLSMIASCSRVFFQNFLDPPLHPSVDPEHVLKGNFAPVDEIQPTECLVVEGELPPSLTGAYIRNGPNPQHQPRGPHHLFSGDGMLHSIRLTKGRAVFCSRYVQTLKYKLEHEEGFPFIPNGLSGFYGIRDLYKYISFLLTMVAKQINVIEASGLANTSVAFFHGSLFALMDGDLPYKVRLTQDGDIETLERYDFNGKPPLNMNPHPRFDIDEGILYGFQLHAIYPHLTLFRFDSSKREDVPIFSFKGLSYLHDLAITKRFVIFLDIQLEISISSLLLKGMPVSYQPKKVSRIGILPRYASSDSDLRWFNVPKLNAFHIVNAWEENENKVVMITPTFNSPHDIMYNPDDCHLYLEKIIIDMNTCVVSRTILSKQVVEMGSINPAYHGKKNRYVYMAMNKSSIQMCGVVKIDLELECEVAIKLYGPGCFGGEAYFVPVSDANDKNSDEDDGFVVSFVHNEDINESFFVVLDAKSLEYVTKVKLPGRVPYGIHGLFVTEKELEDH